MKAIVLSGPGRYGLAEMPIPDPRPDEVLLKVYASGICGTDLHLLRGHNLNRVRYPVVPGHEFYGEVVAVGSAVDASVPAVGDLVAVDPAIACGRCGPCRRGRPNLCDNKGGYGSGRDGGFAEYAAVLAAYCHRLPPGMPPQWAVLAEPVACALRALDRLGSCEGDDVLIYGAGTLGMLMTQLLTAAGANSVNVVDTNVDRVVRAERFGVTAAARTPEEIPGGSAWAGAGWDLVIDATGVPAAITDGIPRVAKGGRFLLMGVAGPGDTVDFPPLAFLRGEMTLLSSVSVVHTLGRALRALARGAIAADAMIAQPVPLARFDDALADLTAGATLKVVVGTDPEEGKPSP